MSLKEIITFVFIKGKLKKMGSRLKDRSLFKVQGQKAVQGSKLKNETDSSRFKAKKGRRAEVGKVGSAEGQDCGSA